MLFLSMTVYGFNDILYLIYDSQYTGGTIIQHFPYVLHVCVQQSVLLEIDRLCTKCNDIINVLAYSFTIWWFRIGDTYSLYLSD